ncbi:ubiquinone biosynthesis monooxygenase COQ6 [Kwoniella heveanensis CBS 569]|nr:ubiquinone biosynthesis monooxygenase COQ6 [Kwoniella heveanensis CBS 569]
MKVSSNTLSSLPRVAEPKVSATIRTVSRSGGNIGVASRVTSRSIHSEGCTTSTKPCTRTKINASLSSSSRTSCQLGGARSHSYHAAAVETEPEPIPPISNSSTYDIVIIGGSNAGLALACALLAQPTLSKTTRILLLEGSSLDKTRSWSGKGDWENRVSSLTAENVGWLESIGVWKHIEESRSCAVDEMVIWANPSPSSTPTIHFPPLGHPMARMTENMNLQRALLRRIEEIGSGIVDIRESSRVGEMRLGEGGRWVGLRVGEEWIRGSLVVGADGPNSPVRKFSNIESYGHAYSTHAVVATLFHPPSPLYPNSTAFQRFLPTGPLAFLPLNEEASTMVWSTLPPHAAALKRLSMEALTAMVNAGFTLPESTLTTLTDRMIAADDAGKGTPLMFEEIIDHIATSPTSVAGEADSEQAILPPMVTSIHGPSVAGFPLRLSHAEEYLGDRTALVGDAAHTIHPLAGQGLNQGLADVRSLAETLETARSLGGDLGTKTSLAPYPRERYPLNHLILSTTDKLHYIFRARNGPINWLRGTGLDIINEIGPLKKILMGGAGAGPSATSSSALSANGVRGRGRSEKDREFGRSHAQDPLTPSAGNMGTLADGVEGWFVLKGVAKMAGGVLGELTKNGLRKAADALERK